MQSSSVQGGAQADGPPAVSVVIGSNGASGSVERCLRALEPHRDGAEVVVAEPQASDPAVAERFPWARFVHRDGAPVPVLWRDGIEASGGEIVALTISPMEPAPDWLTAARQALETRDAVGGAIEPAAGLRLRDFAEYLCRYARDMPPFEPRRTADLPGDNSAYRREALERVADAYRDGFWEPTVNGRLVAEGAVLEHVPELVVRQGRSADWRAFVRQRLFHGRAYGRQRGADFDSRRNLVGVAGAPAVPLVLTARALREVFGRRRYRARTIAALPLLAVFNVAWAVGEARGHLDVLRGR